MHLQCRSGSLLSTRGQLVILTFLSRTCLEGPVYPFGLRGAAVRVTKHRAAAAAEPRPLSKYGEYPPTASFSSSLPPPNPPPGVGITHSPILLSAPPCPCRQEEGATYPPQTQRRPSSGPGSLPPQSPLPSSSSSALLCLGQGRCSGTRCCLLFPFSLFPAVLVPKPALSLLVLP